MERKQHVCGQVIGYLQTLVTLPERDLPPSRLAPLPARSLVSSSAWLSCRCCWYDAGSKSVGTVGGRDMPCLAISAKCIAIANSSMFSLPSLSKSAKCLERR